MKNWMIATGVALAVHAGLGLALAAYFRYAPEPDALATLDLSSVELSFAEEVDDSAAVAPVAPSEAVPAPPKPDALESPEPNAPAMPLPPDPEGARLPEPKDEPPQMDSENARRDTPDERRNAEVPKPETREAKQPAVAPRQAKVDAPPRPQRTIKPEYPRGARQRGEQGAVTLEIRVNERGAVDWAKVVGSSGFPELDAAAVKAARSARFSPAKSGSASVASTARLTLQFKLK